MLTVPSPLSMTAISTSVSALLLMLHVMLPMPASAALIVITHSSPTAIVVRMPSGERNDNSLTVVFCHGTAKNIDVYNSLLFKKNSRRQRLSRADAIWWRNGNLKEYAIVSFTKILYLNGCLSSLIEMKIFATSA